MKIAISIVFIILLITSCKPNPISNPVSNVAKSDLIHYYNFEQNGRLRDLIGNSNSINESVFEKGIKGINGKSWFFNGTNFVDLGESFIEGLSYFTSSCWVNLNKTNIGAQVIWDSGRIDVGCNNMMFGRFGEYWEFRLTTTLDAEDRTKTNIFSYNLSYLIKEKEWHMVTLVYDSKKITGYINDISIGNIGLDGNIRSNESFWLGDDSEGGFGLNGLLDECYFWNNSLSEKEIKKHYNSFQRK